MLLERIESPLDLKGLSEQELIVLAQDLRNTIDRKSVV